MCAIYDNQRDRNITNIVLVGFMGTGKTSVGIQLAKTLHMQFIDTDETIERDRGMSIPEIFLKMGESFFRDIESDLIEKVCKLSGHVIATGGGAVIRERNLQNLRSTGILFCLTATPELILQRTSRFTHRPLLLVEDPIKRICEMLKEREPFYAKADYKIDTSFLTIDQVVERIASLFKEVINKQELPPLNKGGLDRGI